MLAQLSAVPAISIHFALEDPPAPEPASPFDRFVFQPSPIEPTNSLLPPSTLSPKQQEFKIHRREAKAQQLANAGVDPIKFQAFVNAATMGTQTSPPPAAAGHKMNLRKELALKVHQSKQMERRALFLSKVEALPSPTATATPATPPESPAVFHFSLPSPGLVSPLALFESLENVPEWRNVRVEHVDFRAKAKRDAELLAKLTGNVGLSHKVHGVSPRMAANGKENRMPMPRKGVPSLEQISKRLGGNITVTRAAPAASPAETTNAAVNVNSGRLPAFLKRQQQQQQRPTTPVQEPVPAPSPPSSTSTSTIRQPVADVGAHHHQVANPSSVPKPSVVIQTQPQVEQQSHASKVFRPVRHSTRGGSLSALEDLTTSSSNLKAAVAGQPLTAQALEKLAKRNERGSMMVEKLKRRVSAPVNGATIATVHVASGYKEMKGGF